VPELAALADGLLSARFWSLCRRERMEERWSRPAEGTIPETFSPLRVRRRGKSKLLSGVTDLCASVANSPAPSDNAGAEVHKATKFRP
jgi:hypothetical protein